MFSYYPLWNILRERKINKTTFAKNVHISFSTLAKMNADQNISMDNLNKICNFLDCEIQDIIKHSKDY